MGMFIYALTDPRTNEIRYIGKTTKTLQQRFNKHLDKKALRAKNHKNDWIKCLLRAGLKPGIVSLRDDVADSEELKWEERWWISAGYQLGLDLTNSTWGGDGSSGLAQSDEAKAKISHANTGKIRSEQARKNMSIAGKGRPKTQEHRDKIGAAHKGRVKSDEHRKKISITKTGVPSPTRGVPRKPLSEEHKRKISIGGAGRVPSAETRLKLSRANGVKPIMDSNGIVYQTLSEASQKLGIRGQMIHRVLIGTRKNTHGYSFRYVEET